MGEVVYGCHALTVVQVRLFPKEKFYFAPNMQVTSRPLRREPNIPPDGSCDWLLLSWSCGGREVMDRGRTVSVAGLTRVLNDLEESSLSSSSSSNQGDVALIRLSALRSSPGSTGATYFLPQMAS